MTVKTNRVELPSLLRYREGRLIECVSLGEEILLTNPKGLIVRLE